MKWREAIGKEIGKMKDMIVWKLVPRTSMPQGKRCVCCKWVFDIKRNGVFRARLVACGRRDGFTKKISQEIYNKHSPTYLQDKDDFV